MSDRIDPETADRLRTEGERMALVAMLGHVLGRLGYDDPAARAAWWIKERESAIATLRDVCGSFGDNDWSADASLTDIIDKHLARHLHEE